MFIGAWGVANALSRFIGTMMSGVIRDIATQIINNSVYGYIVVFILEAGMLAVSLVLLQKISVKKFQKEAREISFSDKAALLE